MTNIGEENTSLFLPRFALLAIDKFDAAEIALGLIDDAAESVVENGPRSAVIKPKN